MRTSWADLSAEAIESLKAQLFQAIVSSAPQSMMIARKLLVVVGTFALQVGIA
jgi:hypothetical protein